MAALMPRLAHRASRRARTIAPLTKSSRLFHSHFPLRHDAPAAAQSTPRKRSAAPFSPPPYQDKLSPKTSIKFTIPDNSGSLTRALQWFEKHGISMTRLESRPSKQSSRDYDFYVDFYNKDDDKLQSLIRDLSSSGSVRDVHVLEGKKVAWFPRRLKDLDLIANEILDAGADLQSDHPGFHDREYRQRREMIATNALNYRQGEQIPRINYSENEIQTWSAIWDQLMPLLKRHACHEHVRLLPLLIENCGYQRNNIPQIQDISDFLKECTGFTIRPVAGLLSARNFLYGLAFRVFFSTQYLRHHSKPFYTPEPDLVHELMGHAPMFADQSFADFSQVIGLSAIGATDEQIQQLARCYWFTVEFGLCLQNNERKAYGAGLLSSFGELEYSMSNKPKIRPFDPFSAGNQEYPITEYQPVYYQAESFESAKQKMIEFSETFARPFNVRYNPFTQTIEVDSNIKMMPSSDNEGEGGSAEVNGTTSS